MFFGLEIIMFNPIDTGAAALEAPGAAAAASILLNNVFEVAASFGYLLNKLNFGLLPFGYELWVNTPSENFQ